MISTEGIRVFMSKTTLFYGAIVIAIIALALAVYYIVPGVYHPFTFSGTPTDSHKTHAIVFFILFVLLVIVALVNRPKSSAY
jgi:hypothetical protein